MKPLNIIFGTALLILAASPAEASGIWKAAGSAFTSGPGWAMLKIMFIAVGGTLIAYVASAFGKGMLANMIKLLTTFAAIGVVIAEVTSVITQLGKLLGL